MSLKTLSGIHWTSSLSQWEPSIFGERDMISKGTNNTKCPKTKKNNLSKNLKNINSYNQYLEEKIANEIIFDFGMNEGCPLITETDLQFTKINLLLGNNKKNSKVYFQSLNSL